MIAILPIQPDILQMMAQDIGPVSYTHLTLPTNFYV